LISLALFGVDTFVSATFINRVSLTGGATLSSRIVAEIRNAVFESRLKPGDFLGSENDLAQQFGVSRITVRDALRSLSATGIVEIRQGAGGGARIADGNLDHFADALAVQFQLAGVGAEETLGAQSAIEELAAELAAQHRTDDDLERMARAMERASSLVDDPVAFTEASLGFHLAVAEASHNRALVALLRALRYVVWPNENKRANEKVAARVQKSHRMIYEKIVARDSTGAREAMSRHLGGIRDSKHRLQTEVC
jgi:GntR family transcriptional repressor for pyruvate dehydrogenase complex